MENREHDDSQLDVEITDLEPIDENSKFAKLYVVAHSLFTKIHWRNVRSAAQRILVFALLMICMIGTPYSTAEKIVTAHECIRQQSKVVNGSDVTLPSADTTLLEAAVYERQTPASKRLYVLKCA